MDDLISRQAVTKFLNDWLSCLFENCHKQSASDLKMIIKDFKNLPSAQPETNCSEIPNNSDTISRQAAIEHWRLIIDATSTDSGYNMGFVDGLEFCISHLSTMPSAQPEIIRCKDCVYQTESWSGIKYCEAHGDHIGKDYDYCSNARRKENGH